MSTLITQTIDVQKDAPHVRQQIVSVERNLSAPEAYAALALFAAEGADHPGFIVDFDRLDDAALVVSPDRRHGVLMCIVPDREAAHA